MEQGKQKKTKFTPGPWTACGGTEKKLCTCLTVGSEHHPIANVIHGEWGDEYCNVRLVDNPKGIGKVAEAFMDHCWYGDVEVEQAHANARLIAAAPEMYDALQAFIEAWDKSHQLEKTDVARRLAVAAIAKAVQP